MTVNVLGTEYTIERIPENEDKHFTECDGYCDETTKRIVVTIREPDKMDKGNLELYYQKCVRHELIHAFLFESGLCENCEWAHNEEVVDWIAAQFPKMLKAMQDAETLNRLEMQEIIDEIGKPTGAYERVCVGGVHH